MKIAFLTLGCKVNQYETDLLKQRAEKEGYTVVSFDELADIYCINSCSVTNMSDRKTRQMISKARKQNSNAIVAVIGCSVDSDSENISGVDIALGNANKKQLIEILGEHLKLKTKEAKVSVLDISKVKEYSDDILDGGYEIREEVKIEDGCDNFCSYCIIPYLRGRVRSRKLVDILSEVEKLVASGVREVILVGIEIASYGKDLQDIDLFNILDELQKVDGLERVRLGSLEPRFLSLENIERLSKYSKLCNHFHISMQSGSTSVLKRMNRKYTKEDLVNICNNLRRFFTDVYLAADLIVGFPQETDEEFEDTVYTINNMGLAEIHVFKYSKRKYTVASNMIGQVDGNVKKVRSQIIMDISKKSNECFLSGTIGSKTKVLFESFKSGELEGYTSNYIKVRVEGESNLCGTIQDVDITLSERGILTGKLS